MIIWKSLTLVFIFSKFLYDCKRWSINFHLFKFFLFLLKSLSLIVSSMYFIWGITHFTLWKLRVLLTLGLYTLYLNIKGEANDFLKGSSGIKHQWRQRWHSVELKLVMQGFLKDIIEVGSINFVHKCIHKEDAAAFHHIIHRRNI